MIAPNWQKILDKIKNIPNPKQIFIRSKTKYAKIIKDNHENAKLNKQNLKYETANAAPMVRSQFLGIFFLAGFVFLSFKLGYIVFTRDVDIARTSARAEAQQTLERGDITDRNGVLLATSVTTYSLFADPSKVWDPVETATALRTIFPDMSEKELVDKLASSKRFVWIKRKLTSAEKQKVWALAQPGLEFEPESQRVYPMGSLAGHILGGTNSDGKGITGLEKSLEGLIISKDKTTSVKLSIDSRVQYVVEKELAEAAVKYRAVGGTAAIMDINTGEIIASASWPFMNPNDYGANDAYSRQNRLIQSVYEMGSTFKTFTFAVALNDGKITPDSQFDVSHPLQVGRFQINDFHGENRVISAREVLAHSSNIGTAMISRLVGKSRLQEFFGQIGLLDRISGELLGAARPIVPKTWEDARAITASYGHGIAVSPLAVLAAYGAVSNGGIYIKPTFLARPKGSQIPGTRIISEATSKQIIELLRDVVSEGTGRQADSEYYNVAGKTGTAIKVGKNGYDHNRNVSSFAGIFPAAQPRYAILFLLDEPKFEGGGAMTAGLATAPSVAKIVSRVGPMLDITPLQKVDDTNVANTTATNNGQNGSQAVQIKNKVLKTEKLRAAIGAR
ncbi:peptidoglycan D,D-transpeptidase FtsI family protein [Pseudaquidulcibacter saccharophilus]|uniref:peptidoglycan D,D-transpeptidase FtsI family protein n=1 Tax=Pseudaquidulcibacter saccharophilus TaxID=2831900 RepID=UPI001EFF33F0|nr:penicillin-binding protein 2 [Pseudaquidulcibacter saccharophilus]